MLIGKGISKKYITKKLGGDYTITTRRCVTSTNALLKEEAKRGKSEFSVLIAGRQTAGRGRLGRSFHSPDSTGIYMSILLKLDEKQNPLFITTDAAVCLVEAIEELTGEKAQIKWVNDIYLRGKKVCGILTERVGNYAVLGIGINVLSPRKGFPDDIKDRAGAVFDKTEKFLRERVIVKVLSKFKEIYNSSDRQKLLEKYITCSMVIGKEIMILKEDGDEMAQVLGIDENYSLVVKKEDGEVYRLSSGDVSIKMGK